MPDKATVARYLLAGIVGALVFAVFFALDRSAFAFLFTPKQFLLFVGAALVACLFFVVTIPKNRLIYISLSTIELLLAARLVWIAVSSPEAIVHPSNLGFWILTSLALLTLLVRQVSTNERGSFFFDCSTEHRHRSRMTRYFLHGLWMAGVAQAVFGLVQAFFAQLSGGYPTQLVKTPMLGTIGSANGYGSFLAVCIMAALASAVTSSRRIVRVIACLAAVLMSYALWANGSRGAMLGLVGAIVLTLGVYLVMLQQHASYKGARSFAGRAAAYLRERKELQATLVVTVLAGLIGFGFFLYQMNPASANGRFMVWEISLPMLVDHSVAGVGYGRFGVEYLDYQARYFSEPAHLHKAYKAADLASPLSEYLNAFCETGVVGGVLFLLIWTAALWSLLSSLYKQQASLKNPCWGLLALLLVILIHASVDSVLHSLSLYVIAHVVLGLIPSSLTSYSMEIKRWPWLAVVLLVSIGFAIFAVGRTYHQYPAYDDWARGFRHMRDSSYTKAARYFKVALDQLPQKGRLQFHLGRALVLDSSYKQGIHYLEQSLQHFDDRDIHLALSSAHLQLGELEAAERQAKRASAMFPDQIAPYLLLGEVYYHQGKIRSSKAALLRCIRRETHIQSDAVAAVARKAERLWEELYWEELYEDVPPETRPVAGRR